MVAVQPMGRLEVRVVVEDMMELVAQEILQVFRHPKEMLAAMLLARRLNTHQVGVAVQVLQVGHLVVQHLALAVLAQQVQYLVLQ